jgi:pimeloyl-ACP methyl ester carboxylesterase
MNDPAPPEAEWPASLLDRAVYLASGGIARVVVHPVRVPPVPTPRAAGLAYRSVRIPSGDIRLAAWHVPCPGSRRGLVLCHGHNNCRAQFRRMLRPLHEAGFHLLLFDFRAMGASGGSLCTYGYREQHDVLAALSWLRSETEIEQAGLYGLSMGAASALLAAAHDDGVTAVVADSGFAHLGEMLARPFWPFVRPPRPAVTRSIQSWAEAWSGARIAEVDPEAALRRWRPRPLLVIHGERDRLVPPDHGRRLAAAAGPGAELWLVPNAPHVVLARRWSPAYRDRVVGFFSQHLGEPNPRPLPWSVRCAHREGGTLRYAVVGTVHAHSPSLARSAAREGAGG